jgi:hypothetical protein
MSASDSGAPDSPLDFEIIADGVRVFAYLVRARATSDSTRFLTPDDLNLQLGMIAYRSGGRVLPHRHLPVERTKRGTMEAVLVRNGLCDVDIYDDAQVKFATRTLVPGDLVLLVSGGHGFRMREDTVLLEVKEGPYVAGGDKVVFDDSGQ